MGVDRPLVRWIISFFLLLSGFSALVYQLVWLRLLGLSVGSTAASLGLVLAAYFLGMGFGSYFAGNILKKFKNALKIYIVVEVFIALSALLLLGTLLNLDSFIASLSLFEVGLVSKFFVVISLLFIPTFLIGTTFPLLASLTVIDGEYSSSKLAMLYSFNTLGAVLGALVCAIVLIPHFGLDGALYVAAFINILIAIIAFIVYRYFKLFRDNYREPTLGKHHSEKIDYRVLAVLFITGLSAMATEVGWMKFLIIYTGNTIYGFSLILSMFLIGISIGSFMIKSHKISHCENKKLLFFGLIFLSIALLFARIGLGVFPELYEYINSWQSNPFVYRWSKYLLMFLILFPATVLFGTLFPIALKVSTTRNSNPHYQLGRAYAVNIIGGILGSMLAGFLIIPYFSTDILLTMVAFLVLLSSFMFVRTIQIKKAPIILGSFSLLFIFLSIILPHINYAAMINIVLERESHSNAQVKIHYLKEGDTGVISVVSYADNPCVMKLLNNGMNESLIDICNKDNLLLSEFLLGTIPSILNSSAKKAFVVGYGGGTTVKALAMTNLQRIEVVELEPRVLDAVKTLYNDELPTYGDKRVNITINDARNSLLMSDEKYDIIVSQPSHPWLNGSSNIMNKDFFEIVSSRLSQDGIYAQWVPLFKIDVATLRSIIKAYVDTFEYVISFVNPSTRDFLMFGSNNPIFFNAQLVEQYMQNKEISKVLYNHNIKKPQDLMNYFALSAEQLHRVSSLAVPATDENLLAETFYSRYENVVGNSFDTLGFIKAHMRDDIKLYNIRYTYTKKEKK